MKIRTLTCQSSFAFRNRKSNVKISISIISFISLSSKLDSHTIFYSFWYIDSFFYLFTNLTTCMTMSTFFDNFFSFSLTSRTWASLFHNTKYCLDTFLDLALPITSMTLLGFSSFSTTMMAGCSSIEFYLTTRSMNSIFKGYLDFHLDIFSNICLLTTSRTPSSKSSTKK